MRIITLALATVFLLSGSAEAQNTHTVKQGQTLSHIAARYGVSQSALLKANKLSSAHKLKLGQKLSIPKPAKTTKSKLVALAAPKTKKPLVNASGKYTVRNGDHDWAIAKKLGTTVSELHRLNPGVRWTTLQIGQALRIPSKKGFNLAALVPTSKKLTGSGSYIVRKNDNDWIIARRVGVTPTQLRTLNPGVKWTGLQIGQKLRVPGGGAPSGGGAMLATNRISTRHAKIAKDNVAIRRGPSTNSAKVTTVPVGTYVTVLDRESGWYKLKFPKGTVGWVRGDMLKPLSSRLVANSSTRTRRTNYVASKTVAPPRPLGSASGGLLDTAYDMLGVRYRYGSASRSATDCSGFTSQVYKAHGVKLPRTSREQAKVGQAVKKTELKKGDLVFFTRGSRIGHVGMYVGDGKFIHASSSGRGVRVDNLNSGTYQRRYVGARRVANMTAKEKADLKKLEDEAQEMARKAKEQEREVTKGASEPAFEPPAKEPKDATPKGTGTDEINR